MSDPILPDVAPIEARIVRVRDVDIGNERPFVLIAGPCQIESEAHAFEMADALSGIAKAAGVPLIYKSSYDKANRTSGGAARGGGILAAVRERFRIPVLTDVHAPDQCDPAAEAVDILQIPAFLCRQTDLLLAAGETGRAINIKKGQFLAPQDCANIVAKFTSFPAAKKGAAKHRLVLIERGTSFGYNTLVTDFRALPIMRGFGVPVIFDGTHSVQAPGGLGTASGGCGHFAPMMMRAAMAVGVEGVFMETHDEPAKALSDGPNVVPARELLAVLKDLRAIHDLLGRRDPPVPRG